MNFVIVGPSRTPLFGRRRGPLHLHPALDCRPRQYAPPWASQGAAPSPRLWTAGSNDTRGFHPFGFYQKTDKTNGAGCTSQHAGHSGLSPV